MEIEQRSPTAPCTIMVDRCKCLHVQKVGSREGSVVAQMARNILPLPVYESTYTVTVANLGRRPT